MVEVRDQGALQVTQTLHHMGLAMQGASPELRPHQHVLGLPKRQSVSDLGLPPGDGVSPERSSSKAVLSSLLFRDCVWESGIN